MGLRLGASRWSFFGRVWRKGKLDGNPDSVRRQWLKCETAAVSIDDRPGDTQPETAALDFPRDLRTAKK